MFEIFSIYIDELEIYFLYPPCTFLGLEDVRGTGFELETYGLILNFVFLPDSLVLLEEHLCYKIGSLRQ